ncbi:MAG: thioesterase family protein [Rikenellaceae bacterium]|jgi:predicted thioesterase|nr:thioesterase family protein [Rikenellaceae bacterium]
MELKIGMTHTAELVVGDAHSARHWGSGALDVLSTPAMVALMENAAMNTVAAALPVGSDTVGTALNINHIRATRLGETVQATAILREIEGRQLLFEVTACDSKGEIGNGWHTRFVVDRERFLSKL